MGKMISYNEMIRNKPLMDYAEDSNQEVSIGCPVCLETFIAKITHKKWVRCTECGCIVDL